MLKNYIPEIDSYSFKREKGKKCKILDFLENDLEQNLKILITLPPYNTIDLVDELEIKEKFSDYTNRKISILDLISRILESKGCICWEVFGDPNSLCLHQIYKKDLEKTEKSEESLDEMLEKLSKFKEERSELQKKINDLEKKIKDKKSILDDKFKKAISELEENLREWK